MEFNLNDFSGMYITSLSYILKNDHELPTPYILSNKTS